MGICWLGDGIRTLISCRASAFSTCYPRYCYNHYTPGRLSVLSCLRLTPPWRPAARCTNHCARGPLYYIYYAALINSELGRANRRQPSRIPFYNLRTLRLPIRHNGLCRRCLRRRCFRRCIAFWRQCPAYRNLLQLAGAHV